MDFRTSSPVSAKKLGYFRDGTESTGHFGNIAKSHSDLLSKRFTGSAASSLQTTSGETHTGKPRVSWAEREGGHGGGAGMEMRMAWNHSHHLFEPLG